MKKMTKNDFILKAKQLHNNKYDYSLVNYVSMQIKIKIICPDHGVFKQRPMNHLNKKQGCPKCGTINRTNNQKNKLSKNDFIKKSNKIHNNKYDYSFVEYKNNKTKIKIVCPKHGIFLQSPLSHLSGNGCAFCAKQGKLNNEIFIQKSNKIHNNKYDYSLTKYINMKKKVNIICNIHNITFQQSPESHLKGSKCPLCANLERRLKRIEEISKNKFNGYQVIPSFNKNSCYLFDKMMKKQNIYIHHAMNGGEHYIKELGYWLDGYDRENNVVYEFDEKHHFDKSGNLKEKDLIRQKEIENFLKCKFIRIKNN